MSDLTARDFALLRQIVREGGAVWIGTPRRLWAVLAGRVLAAYALWRIVRTG